MWEVGCWKPISRDVQNQLPGPGPQEWVIPIGLAMCSHCHLLAIVCISASPMVHLETCTSCQADSSHCFTIFSHFKVSYSSDFDFLTQNFFQPDNKERQVRIYAYAGGDGEELRTQGNTV